jgi:hypothetical protein
MTGSTLQLKPLSTLDHSWSLPKDVAKTQVRERGERSQLKVVSFVASMLAAITYTLVALTMAAVAIITLVIALPWLLLAPMIIAGLLVSLVGLVLGGLGLI